MENTNPQTNQSVTLAPPQSISTEPATNYKKGSFSLRLGAYLIDGVIVGLVGALISFIVSLTKLDILNLLKYVIALLYGIVFISRNGATPGMRLLKLKVVNTQYQKVGYSTAIGRALASILSTVAFSLGYYWMLIDRKRQTWHDKLANTYVVELDNNSNLIPFAGNEIITTGQKVLFGLVALMIPLIGILAVLLAIALIAINPAKQFSQAENTKRLSDVNAIENAVSQYKAEHNSQLPQGITNTPEEISSQGVNLCSVLVPTYIASLPVDPKVTNASAITSCQSPYDTGYTVSVNAQGLVTVSAPKAGLNNPISVTR